MHSFQATGMVCVGTVKQGNYYLVWCVAEDNTEALADLVIPTDFPEDQIPETLVRSIMAAPLQKFFQSEGVLNGEDLQATGPFRWNNTDVFAVNGRVKPGLWSAFLVLGAENLAAAIELVTKLRSHYSEESTTVLGVPSKVSLIPLFDVYGGALTPITNFKIART